MFLCCGVLRIHTCSLLWCWWLLARRGCRCCAAVWNLLACPPSQGCYAININCCNFYCVHPSFPGAGVVRGGGLLLRTLWLFVLCVERLVLRRLRSCGCSPVPNTRVFLSRLWLFPVTCTLFLHVPLGRSCISSFQGHPWLVASPMQRRYIVLHACDLILWFPG